MAIEHDIKTKGFANESIRLRVNLLFTTSWLQNSIKQFLAPWGITAKQFNILGILRGHKGETLLSVLEIRDRMIDRMSDASRIVDRLEKKGLIIKHSCTMDKRATRIDILPAGLKLLAKIDQSISSLDDCVSGLNDTEMKQLNFLLDKLRAQAPKS